MELTLRELKALKEYISAKSTNRLSKDVIRDCRSAMVFLCQEICITDLKLDANATDFKNPIGYVIDQNFFGIKNRITGNIEYKSQLLKKVCEQLKTIRSLRNIEEYDPDDFGIGDTAEQCRLAAKMVLEWYVNHHRKYSLDSISNLTNDEKAAVSNLFTVVLKRTERIIERETYYVILLVDSSESMIWPYLKDPNNYNKYVSEDYKNAIIQLQSAMQFAHEKALTALRGSSVCIEGYLKIYQYTFNQKKKLLNPPEELSQVGSDKVTKINKTTYLPGGATALYDVIDESLKVIYDNYLKKAMYEEKRIDKVVIAVITDGEDTVLTNPEQKAQKINEIKEYLKMLRGGGDLRKSFLVSSVLIGLTGSEFTENKLKEIRKEMGFDESVSINQASEQSIRKAFKLFSTNVINV